MAPTFVSPLFVPQAAYKLFNIPFPLHILFNFFILYSSSQSLSSHCVLSFYPVVLHTTSLPVSKHLFPTQTVWGDTVFHLFFPPIWIYLEKLKIRNERIEAPFTHFSIILPLGWPFGGYPLRISQWKNREDREIQIVASCFQIWDLLPSSVTTEAKNIPWYCRVGWLQWQKVIKRWFWKLTAESQSPCPVKHMWISLRDKNYWVWPEHWAPETQEACQCTFLT